MLKDRQSPMADEIARLSGFECSTKGDGQDFIIQAGELCLVYNLGNETYSFDSKDSIVYRLCETYPDSSHFMIIQKELNKIRQINSIDEYFKKNQKSYERFDIRELLSNVSRHYLVPKHELITSETDIEKIVEQFDVKKRNLFPHITLNDPMVRYIRGNIGNLVKITRQSPTSGEHIVYRVIV